MIIEEEDYLAHYGTLRKSGRYPYGSGSNPGQHTQSFLDHVAILKAQGMSLPDIAKGMGMTTTELIQRKSIIRNEQRQAKISMAERLSEKGLGASAIGERMGIPESSVRSLLSPGQKDRADVLQTTASMLKDEVDSKGYLDIGTGVEHYINVGISETKLKTSVAILKDQGYVVKPVQVPQAGTKNKTTVLVLAPPGTTYRDIVTNMDKINTIVPVSDDGGRSFYGVQTPMNISSKRVGIRYAEDGGKEADGVIFVRPGVDDVSIGATPYAQVRIAIDGTHYLKGMAVYKNDLPDGVDLLFNTSKTKAIIGTNKLDAMKKLERDKDGNIDADHPFGSVIRQLTKVNGDGTRTLVSAMNIVGSKEGMGEAGGWDTWKKALASQVLSKQSPTLAKTQLAMTYERRKNDLDAIMKLTNPAIRKKLLEVYAEETDSSAVHLEAANLPRQSSHVILPIKSMKETEIYAPNYNPGERVALIRYPHGGKFEIPELVVNNNQREAKALLGLAPDAVGISHKVAERLSGADFDGDTVLVIPNDAGYLKSESALAGLKNFDPQHTYPKYEGMTVMDAHTKAREMGDISNLITDMTIRKATNSEIAAAVRHSMVVIDAEKHELNYRESAKVNGIAALKKKYQGKSNAGASTLISLATSRKDVPERKQNFRVDPATGKKIWVETGASYEKTTVSKRTGIATTKTLYPKTITTKLADTDDARTLSSGTLIETVYADHSNRLKALANTARKEAVNTRAVPYSASANKAYSNEVQSLTAKLNVAQKNRPRERYAQLLANTSITAKKVAHPEMTNDDLKKIRMQALIEARTRAGAKKEQVHITDIEWAAIQAGAITNHRLTEILKNADLDRVKELATPRTQLLMSPAKSARAATMLAGGYTQADVAKALGVSLTTLKKGLG